MIPPNALPQLKAKLLVIAIQASRRRTHRRVRQGKEDLQSLRRAYAKYPGARTQIDNLFKRYKNYITALVNRISRYKKAKVDRGLYNWVEEKLNTKFPHLSKIDDVEILSAIIVVRAEMILNHEGIEQLTDEGILPRRPPETDEEIE